VLGALPALGRHALASYVKGLKDTAIINSLNCMGILLLFSLYFFFDDQRKEH
jgi:hypothetical protein